MNPCSDSVSSSLRKKIWTGKRWFSRQAGDVKNEWVRSRVSWGAMKGLGMGKVMGYGGMGCLCVSYGYGCV